MQKNGLIGLSPEGTRTKVEEWKTGFLRIARELNSGVVLVSLDFLKKENILKANNTWNINEIELYRQSKSKKFLNFKSEKCFSIITYKNFLELLEKSLINKF